MNSFKNVIESAVIKLANRSVYKFSILLMFCACSISQEEASPKKDIRESVYAMMKDWYLFYDKVPIVNPLHFADTTIVEALKYKPADKWSFIKRDNGELAREIANSTEEGSIGAYIVEQEKYARVIAVIKGSPADNVGLKRGDSVVFIRPTASAVTLEWFDAQKRFKSATIPKQTVVINPVLHTQVFDTLSTKIGYWVFFSFPDTTKFSYIEESFQIFRQAGITKLIIDLRYNGGGFLRTMEFVANLLAPFSARGKLMYSILMNDRYSKARKDCYFSTSSDGLPFLSEIVFITSSFTASSSDMLINILKPYIRITTVGQTTVGKYLSYPIFEHLGYTIGLINAKCVNSLGEPVSFEGITGWQPIIAARDGIEFDWGDVRDEMLQAAFRVIASQVVSMQWSRRESMNFTSYRFVLENLFDKGIITDIQER
ncbi:MAG: S41 family peptidase [Cytophagales bacterium]|nr:S41 family peptidase [Cytophagales bacterium]MDW8383840.1 S41 family peptidase [Flammeovirgaceae bacterium]